MKTILEIIRIAGGLLVVAFFGFLIGVIWGEWIFWLKCMGTDLILIGVLVLTEKAIKNTR